MLCVQSCIANNCIPQFQIIVLYPSLSSLPSPPHRVLCGSTRGPELCSCTPTPTAEGRVDYKACDCHISACVFTVPHLRLAKRHRQKRLPADFFLAQVKVPLPCTSASSCCINPQAIITEHVNMVAPLNTPIYIIFHMCLYMISIAF